MFPSRSCTWLAHSGPSLARPCLQCIHRQFQLKVPAQGLSAGQTPLCFKNSHKELPTRKARGEPWLLVKEGLTCTPAPNLYPAVSCQCSSGSNFSGHKSKTNTLWSHGGFEDWLHLCHPSMNCLDGSHPPVECLCRLRLSCAQPLTLRQEKQPFWAIRGERGGRLCLSCSKIVLQKDKLTLMTFKYQYCISPMEKTKNFV